MNSFTTISLAIVLLLSCGCGEPPEQRRLEQELNTQIDVLHDSTMTLMPAVKDLLTRMPAMSFALEQKMQTKPPPSLSGTIADMKAAHEELVKAQSLMQSWMKAHKRFDENQPHEAVMAGLTREKQELTAMLTALIAALAQGNAVCDTATRELQALAARRTGKSNQHK